MTRQPVRHLVVVAHPDPESYCMTVARCWQAQARKHHQACDIRDLYADNFDPVLRSYEQPGKPGYKPRLDAVTESMRLRALDVLVLVYPIWFGTPPAMMKGYLERVVGAGTSFAAGVPSQAPLDNVRLVQISTSAASDPWLAEEGVATALNTIFKRYVAKVFGARASEHLHLDSIGPRMSPLHAWRQLARIRDLADRTCAAAAVARHRPDLASPFRPLELERAKVGQPAA